MDNLTNDAKFLLSSMYKTYIDRRKSKISKEKAVLFGDVNSIHENIMPEWEISDVNFTCFELRRKGLISGLLAGNTIFYVSLTTDAIAIMESKFEDDINKVLDFAVKVKSLIPFI
ncbi:hypothetical protein [Enterococcus gilvus]|uniref:Uncharacterized protein n=1 Tax=Enterococcus gilvus ATCC BAA-350 TaxID=1158614 RepID=R2XTW8_9ENTE|nr:hypothetical protein [Enterococcus gilvus]EOI53427.1 hypothetical protein UKC_03379 [Enterococcus gilvus ATCC BAA-350]EOW81298.1 hypothetical protein I592_00583 [Enterococcus gilvus ATCC BAA-350]